LPRRRAHPRRRLHLRVPHVRRQPRVAGDPRRHARHRHHHPRAARAGRGDAHARAAPGAGLSIRALPVRVRGMGKLIVINHLTLDGVMQAPGRPGEDTRDGFAHGGWGARRDDPALAEAMGPYLAASALLLGRRTYEDFAAYWP